MKIYEILSEGHELPDLNKLNPEVKAAMRDALTIPGISLNRSNGSSYLQYRFGLAMAGAPDYPTQATGAIAGDPLMSAYTDAELEIINKAAEWVGAGKVMQLSDNRSRELDNTNTVSPVQPRGPIALKKRKKNK